MVGCGPTPVVEGDEGHIDKRAEETTMKGSWKMGQGVMELSNWSIK